MKRLSTLLACCCMFTAHAQFIEGYDKEKETREGDGYHQHDGFYLSMGLGPAFGDIISTVNGSTTTLGGTGAEFDFKIGGAINDHFIVHATLNSKSIVGPSVSGSSGSGKASDDVSLDESMYGVGFTNYSTSNAFFSISIGLGKFTLSDLQQNVNISSTNGFSMQVKLGKEWWIAKNWGLGGAITYGKTVVNDGSGSSQEKLNSNRFGILFSATFN